MQGRSVGFQSRLRCPGAIGGQDRDSSLSRRLCRRGRARRRDDHSGDGDRQTQAGRASAAPSSCSTEVLAQNPHLKEIIERSDSASELRSVYPVYFPPRRCVADGALLVGDAARVSEPVTGEGIYFAMRSGLLAAETYRPRLAARKSRRGCFGRLRARLPRALFARAWRSTRSFVFPCIAPLSSIRSFVCRRKTGAC